MEEAAFVAQPVFPIFLQEQGTVEIDEAGLLRQQYRRCHSQRGGDHAADHQVQSARARLGCQAQALAEAAGLVELEVDAFIAGGQFREIGGDVAGFVGAEGDRVFELGEQGVLGGGQRLFNERDAQAS